MSAPARALLILVAAAAVGALLWLAAQLETQSTGGYWAAHVLIAVGGLLVGLTQFRADDGTRPALPLLVVAPALVVALWLLVTADPGPNTYRNHFREWSSDLGINAAVADIGRWHGVLAFGFGLLVGLAASPRLFARRRHEVVPPPAAAPARLEEPETRVLPPPAPAPAHVEETETRILPPPSAVEEAEQETAVVAGTAGRRTDEAAADS